MHLEVLRYFTGRVETRGLLLVDGEPVCHTLEDSAPRVPAGTYPVRLRTEGTIHEDYARRFPGFHRGTLHIHPIPGWSYILIHIGNSVVDTRGCLLVGNRATWDGLLVESTLAYKRLYGLVAPRLAAGEEALVDYRTLGGALA